MTLRRLIPGTTYHYRVVSIDGAENTGLSSRFTFDVRPLIVNFTALSGQTNPLQQPIFSLDLGETFPLAITGQVELGFLSTATNPSDDPSIQFSSGGRTLDFTIPANRAEAVFASLPAFQTGTVAGRIKLSVGLFTIPSPEGGPQALNLIPVPNTSTVVPPMAPVVSRVSVENAADSSFDVVVTAYSTTRTVQKLSFRFTAKDEKTTLDPDTAVLPGAEGLFTQWYQDPQSGEFGSQFVISVPFEINGNLALLGSVFVTITNEIGASEEVEGSF